MITKDDFKNVIKLINNLWGVQFDESKAQSWYVILRELNLRRLYITLQTLAPECAYPPKIKQIADKYDELRRQHERAERQKRLNEWQKHIEGQVSGQYICPICKNTGDYFHEKDGYAFHLRCSCARGKDLNKWSSQQLTKGMTWHNKQTGRDENLYVPCVDDVLSAEEIEIIKLKNTGDELERSAMSHAELNVQMQSFIKGMAG